MYVHSPKEHFIHVKGCFWSVIDHLRRLNTMLKKQLQSTACHLLGILCTPPWRRRTFATWKNQRLHSSDCPFLTEILTYTQITVSFTKETNFPSKAYNSLLHLVTRKTNFSETRIFHNHLLYEHLQCVLGHLLLPRRLNQVPH